MQRRLLAGAAAGALALAAPSAWAGYTKTKTATSSFSSSSISAPVTLTGVRCTVAGTLAVTWTKSSTAYVTSQVVAYSTSSTFATTTASFTYNNNTQQSHTFSSVGVGVYYARVTSQFSSWTKASNTYTVTTSVC